MSERRIEGTLSSWNDDRGFGFLTPDAGRGRVFVHITAFSGGSARPRVGERYAYTVDRHGDRGPEAVRVAPSGTTWSAPRARPARPSSRGRLAVAGAVVVALALTVVALSPIASVWSTGSQAGTAGVWSLDPPVLAGRLAVVGAVALLNLATAVAYAVDKRAARLGLRRIPERSLLLCGLLGGWPAAVVAQQLLRHKTGKPAFRRVFAATVALNLVAVAAVAAAFAASA
ncbi:DUF1294 domain-containing protein [Frigoribacterium sp. CFBP9039]|uniref:DUF1294 domain-containing protein n=1 Tax=Frigoribacterium sp. CFBP9029 TaxID=3096541 RepID=UPI002A6A33BC|nr:DUF1294 domain-containing protein [Frigoribacterium sp. CFBP9039]MDY0946733.1 DUF1294 domain-containing protein [Frigoribacterium sp. CFBP9039]